MKQPAEIERLLAETTWLQALARSLVAGRDTADDVVQETMLRACRRPLQSVQNLRGWLAVVAASVARRFARTELRHSRRLAALPERDHESAAAEIVMRTAMQRDVMDAALRLREPYRTAVLLRFQGELGYAAIAARLDVPIETVRTRIKRGLQLLREELDGKHGETKAWAQPLLGAGWVGTGAVSVVGAAGSMVVAAALCVGLMAWMRQTPDELRSVGIEMTVSQDSTTSGTDSPDSPALPSTDAAPLREPASVEGNRSPPEPPISEGRWQLVGRVVDADSRVPIAAAELELGDRFVRFSPASPNGGPAEAGEFRTHTDRTRTDPTGCFSFDGTQRGGDLVVQAAAYASRAIPWVELTSDREVTGGELDVGDVLLRRGHAIEGRVVAVDGKTPVDGVAVYVAQWTERTQWSTRIATTNAQGAFGSEQPLEEGSRLLLAIGEHGVGWTDLEGREASPSHAIELIPVASLTCTVVDHGGRPVSGARVVATPTGLPYDDRQLRVVSGDVPQLLRRTGVTDAAGRLDLRGLARGRSDPASTARECDLRAFAEGHRGERRTLRLRPGPNEVLLVLPWGHRGTIRGRVVAEDGSPIAQARVAGVAANAAGEFVLVDHDLRNGLVLDVVANGFARLHHEEPLAGRAGDLFVELTMRPASTVRGVVQDQFGVPVAGVEIKSTPSTHGEYRTSRDGTFELPDVPLGAVRVRAVPKFGSLVFSGAVELDVEPVDRERVVLTLRRR